MPLTSLASVVTLKSQARAFLRSRFLGIGAELAQFIGEIGTAWGMALFGIQRTVESIDRDSPPSKRSSKAGINTWGEISGIPSNRGGYGYNGPSVAKGGQAAVTGTNGVVVADGQTLTAPDGVTIIKLVGDVTIPATGSFEAVTPGTVGNLPVDTELTWVTPPFGCDPTVVLSSPLKDAIDEETIAHQFERIQDRWQKPPKGGANIDYKQDWAESIDGVEEAFVYPRRGGTGTVHVVVTAPGSGTARIPSDAVIDAVQTKLRASGPGDVDEIVAMGPAMPDEKALTIRASVFLSPDYEWDWDDTSGTWTVAAYTPAGPATTLTLSSAIHSTLKDAIDNGDKPLIQVINTSNGASVIPQQLKATAYDITEHILTLEAAFAVAPTIGDRVYAGSYAAPIIAQAMLDHVDSLGPSRESSLPDMDTWTDTASIWGIGDAAVQAKDADGKTRLVTKLSDSGGLMIAVGDGALAATDVDPADLYPDAPECVRADLVYAVRANGS